MDYIRTIRCPKMSHRRVIFHVNQESCRWIRITSTTIVAIVVPASICDQSCECLGDSLAGAGDGDILVSPFGVEIAPGRVTVIIKGNNIGPMERRAV